jgi:DNA-binding transcriptional regulator of glucitol operon
MLTSLLAVLFAAYVLQSIFSWFQLKRVYSLIDTIKKQHKGENCHLITGSGRKAFFVIKKGVFMILVVDFDGNVVDYYDMEGYSVFITPKQNSDYIGIPLNEVRKRLTKSSYLAAFDRAVGQLGYLREAADAAPHSSACAQ